MKLRLAQLNDTEKILEIYKPYILHTTVTFEYDVPSEEAFRERVNNIMEKYPYVVCEEKEEIVGYCYGARFKERAAFGYDAELSVYLKEDARNRGIGSALYGAVIEILELMNIRNIYGLVAYPNEVSVRLHKAFGFSLAGRLVKTGYKFGRWIDLMCFERHSGDDERVGDVVYINALDSRKVENILKKYSSDI